MSGVNNLLFRSVDASFSTLLADIHSECFPHYWDSSVFTDFFAVSGTFALLAQSEDGDAVGMVVVRPVHEQSDILTLAVRPAWQRQGIAAILLEKAMEKARHMGAATLFLEVEEGNKPAISLYEKAGFLHTGRRKLYYRQRNGTYTDALVMQRKLY